MKTGTQKNQGEIMAHLYRPSYTRDVPPHAKLSTKNGQTIATWEARGGKKMAATVSPTNPSRCTVEVDCWWIEYHDHDGKRQYLKAFPSRTASERKLVEIRDRVERMKAGDISVESQRRDGRTVTELLAVWRQSLAASDLTPLHVQTYHQRVSVIAEMIKATRLVQFTRAAVHLALHKLRSRQVKPLSPQTSNHYLTATKAFVKWCLAEKYIAENPLGDLEALEVESRRTFTRRAMTQEEFDRLIESTRTHHIPQCPMLGTDRAALYLTAAYTGLRANELGQLERGQFHLDGDSPVIRLPGRMTKNRKDVDQPLPVPVAEQLREWLSALNPRSGIWPGYAWRNGKVSRILRADLIAAGVAVETPDGVIDFHALRTFYATMLARAGVPIQHAQKLMRHSSPTLTAKHYTRLQQADLERELTKLPTPKKAELEDE
jgi:integrase/recombinase XerD